mmetsp:Transcript_70938/g.122975  ORF Transcript_70938/g.122975 Transcript_70938/m.122975 type:complete len:261 (-) Transcript_70938:88-870(-)
MADQHTYIPKRATQHGIFLSGSETSPPSLKPGQKELYRQDLYSEEAKPFQEPYIIQDQFHESVYKKHTSNLTLPEDYVNYDDADKKISAPKPADSGTAHWKSQYRAATTEGPVEEVVFGRELGPRDVIPETGRMNAHGDLTSAYQENFGKYGSNPLSKFDVDLKNPLAAGSTKGTCHVPGYQGFLPTSTTTPEVSRYERGANTRSVDKTNIQQTFHTNIVGYAGHVPQSANNDFGGRKPTHETISGRDYGNQDWFLRSQP